MTPSEHDFSEHPDPDEPHSDDPEPDDLQEDQPNMNDHNDTPNPEVPAIEPRQVAGGRINVQTPTAGQLYAMFPDAVTDRAPATGTNSDLAARTRGDITTPTGLFDLDPEVTDPVVVAALRARAVIVFWARPALTASVVLVVAVIAFVVAGVAVGVAWCLYGAGHTTHSVWIAHGRPRTTELVRVLRHRE